MAICIPLTFFILFILEVCLSSVLQHIDILRVHLEDFATHRDGSTRLLILLITKKTWWWDSTSPEKPFVTTIQGITCVRAWQIRSFARTEKWGTLGSVFITASYLLTASSYLEKQKSDSVSRRHQRSQQQTDTILFVILFSFVNVTHYACKIWFICHTYP